MSVLTNQRHLITGGAGLIGSHVADLLVQRKAREVVILDNFTRGSRDNLAWAMAHGKVTVIEGDILDTRQLAEVMQGIDTVFHMAALRITQCSESPRLGHDTIATGSFNVLEAAVNARVRKVIASSTASIYGMADTFPTTETHHPYNNETLYGAAKCYMEGLLRSFHAMFGLNYVALRYFNVYGPRMDIYGAFTEVMVRWMERIHAGKPPIVMGDGLQTMDFIYVEDVARANILAAEAGVSNDMFNIASHTETSLKELAAAMLKAMDSDLALEYAPPRKVNPVARRLAATDKARRALGFQAEVSLDQGLHQLVEWWLKTRTTPAKS